MPLTLNEAKALLKPYCQHVSSDEWMNISDPLLFIEYNIFPHANIQSSINTVFGQKLAEYLEEEIEKNLEFTPQG